MTHNDTVVIGAGLGGVGADGEFVVAALRRADQRAAQTIHRSTWQE